MTPKKLGVFGLGYLENITKFSGVCPAICVIWRKGGMTRSEHCKYFKRQAKVFRHLLSTGKVSTSTIWRLEPLPRLTGMILRRCRINLSQVWPPGRIWKLSRATFVTRHNMDQRLNLGSSVMGKI